MGTRTRGSAGPRDKSRLAWTRASSSSKSRANASVRPMKSSGTAAGAPPGAAARKEGVERHAACVSSTRCGTEAFDAIPSRMARIGWRPG